MDEILTEKARQTQNSYLPVQDTRLIMNDPSKGLMNKPMITQAFPASMSQVGGEHYRKCEIQPWDYVIANNLDYFQGSIIKYVTRWRDKGGVQDLRKAMHFLEKYIEHESKKCNGLTF